MITWGALAVFMPREKLNEVFDLGDGYYGGYFSDAPLTEIKDEYVGSVIDLDQLTKVSRQLMVSMGASMGLVNGFAVMIFFVVAYLLSKMIIEKNAQSISMTKILGYNGSEIARLYLLSTTVVVVLCLVISLPIEVYVMKFLFRAVMMESMTGWIEMWVSPTLYPRMLAAGLATYAVVAVLEYRRIIRRADGRSAEECGVMGYEKNDTDTFVCGAAAFGLRPGGRHGGNHLGGRPCCRDRDDGADLCPQDHARRRG